MAYKLSRLVRDNAVSTEYAARVVAYADGERQVVPGPVTSEWAIAYRAGTERSWLDADDVAALRGLVSAYWQTPPAPGSRLDRAVARCEASAHFPFAEDAVREVVTGLEALLKTNRHQATLQFIQRVPALARDLKIRGANRRFCDQIYRWRSQASHGARTTMSSGQAGVAAQSASGARQRALDKTFLIESVLRAAIRQALLDRGFRRIFDRPSRIRSRWPAVTPRGRQL